jgi:hypothetical protein
VTLMVFQLLRLRDNIQKVTTFATELETHGKFDVSVQEYQRWNPGFDEVTNPPTELQIFQVEEFPSTMDILKLVNSQSRLRETYSWIRVGSDVDGCICLRDGVPISPGCNLGDPKCPAICLISALAGKGFVGQATRVVHTPDIMIAFDNRDPIKNKFYLQCVVAQEDLFARGCESFPSQLTQPFYQYLLKHPSLAKPGLTAKSYKEKLNQDLGLPPVIAALLADVEHPSSPLLVPEEDPDIAGDVPDVAEQGHDIAEQGLETPQPESSSNSDIIGDIADDIAGDMQGGDDDIAGDIQGGDVDIAGDEDDAVPEHPEFIFGQRVVLEVHRRADGTIRGKGIRIKCNNEEHGPDCALYRSLLLDVGTFGPRAAEFFLMAWLLESHRSAEFHKKFKPGRALVREISDTYG